MIRSYNVALPTSSDVGVSPVFPLLGLSIVTFQVIFRRSRRTSRPWGDHKHAERAHDVVQGDAHLQASINARAGLIGGRPESVRER